MGNRVHLEGEPDHPEAYHRLPVARLVLQEALNINLMILIIEEEINATKRNTTSLDLVNPQRTRIALKLKYYSPHRRLFH